jgi:hypothetical protein
MNALELVALLGLTVWSVYKQTRLAEVAGRGRFKMAIIYAAVGLAVGGFAMPHGIGAAVLLLGGFGLSAVVGWLRGRMTPMWMDADGRVWRKGNVKTVLMFLALVASKFVLGAVAYLAHINDGAGFGEVLFMIAIMIAVQAEIVYRRAQSMFPTSVRPVVVPA